MRKRFTWCGLASACVFSVGVLLTADAQDTGQVTVSVSTEAVGITIVGGDLNFGAQPHHADLRAHPTSSGDPDAVVAPPVVQNSGNLPITHLDVRYDGPNGEQAMCDGGTASWAAVTSQATATDQFSIRAWASTNESFGTFQSASGARYIPTNGGSTANILDGGPLAPEDSVPLLFQMRTPNPGTAGAQGCTIALTVTAAAAE